MLSKKKILIILVLLSLFSVSTVSAADISDNEINTNLLTTDLPENELNDNSAVLGNTNNGTTRIVTEFTTEAINEAINASSPGDTILLLPGTYKGLKNIVVDKSLNIIGDNSIILIDSNQTHSQPLGIMTIDSPNVQLKGITFFNTTSHDAGALKIMNSNIEIIDCKFINNSASSLAGAVNINENCMNILISNCTFKGNRVSNPNDVALGGALRIGNCTNVTVEYCDFINNFAMTDGGAIELDFSQDTHILYCYFENNTALNAGGAIDFWNEVDSGSYVSNCIFVNNKNYYNPKDSEYNDYCGGAGIYLFGDNTVIDNCTFISNEAYIGAGIAITGDNNAVTNCKFIGNIAYDNSSFGGLAAGIFIAGDNASVVNCTFENNIGVNGTSIFIAGTDQSLIKCNVTKNIASNTGAGFYVIGDVTYLENIFATSNVAKNAGVLFVKGHHTTLNDSVLYNNSATINGGAAYIEGSNTSIQHSVFYKNNAIPNEKALNQGLGGAVYMDGNDIEVISNAFDHNTARNGSAIYIAYGSTNIKIDNQTIEYLDKNQAWVYSLPINYNSSSKKVTVVLHGGNNILNAFYNAGNVSSILLQYKNGTYLNPVLGADASQGGKLYYQDDLESNQNIKITAYDLNKNVVNDFVNVTDYHGTVTFDVDLGSEIRFVEATHNNDDYYKAITNLTAINFEDGIVVSNIKMDFGQGEDIWAVYKIDNVGQNNVPINFYAFNLDTNETIYLGSNNTLSGGEVYLKDFSILNTLKPTPNNYLILAMTQDNMTVGNGSLEIYPIDVDLDLKVNVDKEVINVGDEVKISITLENLGPAVAKNTTVTIVLPDGFEIISSNPSIGTFDSSIWDLGNIDLGKYTLDIIGKFNKAGAYEFIVYANTTSPLVEERTGNLTVKVNGVVNENSEENKDKAISHTLKPTGNPLLVAILALFVIPLGFYRRK